MDLHTVVEVIVETESVNVNEDLTAGYVLLGVAPNGPGWTFLLGTDQPAAPAPPKAA
jgi:hypothetical protein